jgi:hypothetical protein
MANCVFCGKSAGLFRSKHPECEAREAKRLGALSERRSILVQAAVGAIKSGPQLEEIKHLVEEESNSALLSKDDIQGAIIQAWCTSVDDFLEDGVIDVNEEKCLATFMKAFGLTQKELDAQGAHTRLVKSAVLRELLSGSLPQRMQFDGQLPINLQKGEKIIWAFAGCDYLEDRTKREYVGGSRGVSVRVMKGVYYRVGSFKGSTVSSTERIRVDKGMVVLTDKHIYFAGPAKSLRIPYEKIVSFLPFEDGLGVVRDSSTAKPQIFKTADGWFTYNLATNLAQFYNR